MIEQTKSDHDPELDLEEAAKDWSPKTWVNKLYWLALFEDCEEAAAAAVVDSFEPWEWEFSYTILTLPGSEGHHSALFLAIQLAFWHLK